MYNPKGIQDDYLIKYKENLKYLENGTLYKTIDCPLKQFYNVRNEEVIKVNTTNFLIDEKNGEMFVKNKYFATNYRFNSFDIFLNTVDVVKVEYGGQIISCIFVNLCEGTEGTEKFMEKFPNLFLMKYHDLTFKFKFKENISFKDYEDLVFSFDIFEVDKNLEEIDDLIYPISQFQYTDSNRFTFNHPCSELIIIINDDNDFVVNHDDLINRSISMKNIKLIFDYSHEIELNLSRNYKNLFIYNFVENIGNTINFSRVEECKFLLNESQKNIDMKLAVVSIQFVRFTNGMGASVFSK